MAQITLLIKACLDEAEISFNDLGAVAISGGPGSYTGLRVGTSTAKGICYANDIPLIAIDTLSIIAYKLATKQENKEALIISIIDARRDEVYMAGFDSDMNQCLDTKSYIITEDSFSKEAKLYPKIIIGGDATDKASRIIAHSECLFEPIIPDAGLMLPLAIKAFRAHNFEELGSYTPYYLKPPNITVSKKQIFRNI